VLLTGGHLYSLEAVAENRAQLAAIDCVSLQMIADRDPGLVARVRVVGDSETTCGLPLVTPHGRYSPSRAEAWIAALGEALAGLPAEPRRTLHLQGFESVNIGQYDSILELERFAVECGYPELD